MSGLCIFCQVFYRFCSVCGVFLVGVVGFVYLLCFMLIMLEISIVWCVVMVWLDLVIIVGCGKLCFL